MHALRLLAAGCLLGAAPLLGLASPAYAAEDTRIAHVEPAGNSVRILVSVPEGADPDLDGVSVTVDGAEATAAAETAEGAAVERTAVLALDTSRSMEGERFEAATAAAQRFLGLVPADVRVGIVTFNRKVTTTLEPTTDRDAARAAIDDLTLALGTRVYDGVLAAVDLTGDAGQRQVLLLSDGANTNGTTLESVTAALTDSEVRLDAVALDQSGSQARPLQEMADAAGGSVIPTDPEALTAAFEAEASTLARQVLVTAELPASVTASEGTVEVTLPDGATTLTASAYSRIRASTVSGGSSSSPLARADDGGIQVPRNALYAGLVSLGLGLAVLLGGLVSMTGTRGPVAPEDRIAAFGTHARTPTVPSRADGSSTLDSAKEAAASMLQRNRGLEARIEHRLEGAGNPLKPAEWLLLHGVVALSFSLFGLLLGNGSILLMLLFLLAGVAVPWAWLGFRRKARVGRFNASLADTLQLMSGSLQAGMSLAQSLDSVVREGQDPIAGEFHRVLVETRLGVPLETALEGVAQRLQSQDFAWVVMAIRIQREVGGNLAELLTTVSATLREREYLRRQVKTLAAEGKLSAYILLALPIGMLVYMLLLRRDYVMPMFTTSLGLLMSAGAVTLMVLGWFLMSRIVKVEI